MLLASSVSKPMDLKPTAQAANIFLYSCVSHRRFEIDYFPNSLGSGKIASKPLNKAALNYLLAKAKK
jgi:hypothetical protein